MTKEIIVENNGAKYSEMLIEIINKFDSQLPENLSFEDVIEISIESWNLANNKIFLESKNLYEQELKSHKYSDVVSKIIDYKQERFDNFNNVIIDYSLENDRLQIKSQTQEENFNSMFKKMILNTPITEKAKAKNTKKQKNKE